MNMPLMLVGLALIVLGLVWLRYLKRSRTQKPEKTRPAGPKPAAGPRPSAVGKTSRGELKSAVGVESAGRKRELAPKMEPKGETRKPSAVAGGATQPAREPTAPSAAGQAKRRSERILLRIPVEVAGTDVKGKSFTESTFTLVVNRHGACIQLKNSPRTGDQITITNTRMGQSCPFRVCGLDQTPPGGTPEWGVECLEPARNFWQISFPEKSQQPTPQDNVHMLLECATCESREMAELSLADYRSLVEQGVLTRGCAKCGVAREWKFAFIEADIEEASLPSPGLGASTPSPATTVGRHTEMRLIAKLPVRIRHQDGRADKTVTENISTSGVCCASNIHMTVGDSVFLTVESGRGTGEQEIPARIAWRRRLNEKGRNLYRIVVESNQSGTSLI